PAGRIAPGGDAGRWAIGSALSGIDRIVPTSIAEAADEHIVRLLRDQLVRRLDRADIFDAATIGLGNDAPQNVGIVDVGIGGDRPIDIQADAPFLAYITNIAAGGRILDRRFRIASDRQARIARGRGAVFMVECIAYVADQIAAGRDVVPTAHIGGAVVGVLGVVRGIPFEVAGGVE